MSAALHHHTTTPVQQDADKVHRHSCDAAVLIKKQTERPITK